MKRFIVPAIVAALVFGFWLSPDFQTIAGGVAVFLFGMLMLEEGFKLLSGGVLERILEKATNSVWKSLGFGIVSTTIMQSSSLVSVITISFLSAGLIPLVAGIGIIFGANIGTTTGAWLIAGFGLKVKISAYAMPMLVLGVILSFQTSKVLRGLGSILAGLGFLFLGIHFMKEGFETFKDQFNLIEYAMPGLIGLVVFTGLGALATVVMQSSHATMVLIITALAAGQITYENALALAIGANIGTTITAILGALTANYQGKRLALAHLLFNVFTAAVALIFISQLREVVDWISGNVGIRDDDYALKLAVFHTVFNVIGVGLMTPLINPLKNFLERVIREPKADLSQPRYLNTSIDAFPASIIAALRNEVLHLYDNALEIIAHGLNLNRHVIFEADDLPAAVSNSRKLIEFDLDQRYEERVKHLYAAIVEFTTRIGGRDYAESEMERIYDLRNVAGQIVECVKAVKHLRKNMSEHTVGPDSKTREIYDEMRLEIARLLVEIRQLQEQGDESERPVLWMDEERVQIETALHDRDTSIDELIRGGSITAIEATSFMNDSGYAHIAMRNLVDIAQGLFGETEEAMAEVERILKLDDEEAVEIAAEHPSSAEPETGR